MTHTTAKSSEEGRNSMWKWPYQNMEIAFDQFIEQKRALELIVVNYLICQVDTEDQICMDSSHHE